MGMPLRILKFAMDFFARVMMGFCPVIWPSSTAAVSSNLAFWLASPRPMLTVTFCTRGTAMIFFQPKRFISAGTVSFRYFSCNRLFIAFPYLCPLLIQGRIAMPATAHFRPVRQHRVPDPRVPLDDSDVLHHHGVLFCVDGQHAPALARVFAGEHFYVVALANLNGVPLGSVVPQCHGLPNLRSQRNNLGEFLLA